MTTQINVTVGSGGLTDRAKQQQQAARQAQLEKERTINLNAEALDKRVAAQAAKNLSIDGQPLYSSSFKQPQIERRPAATRQPEYTLTVGYIQNYANTTYFEPALNTNKTDKSLYRIYSGDGLAFREFEFEYARYTSPAKQWGTTDYNTSQYFFQTAPPVWSPGYEEDPFNPGLILGLSGQNSTEYSDNTNPSFTAYIYSDEYEDAACTVSTGKRFYNRSNDPGDPEEPGIMFRNWQWFSGASYTKDDHIFTRRATWEFGPYTTTYCLPLGKKSCVAVISFYHYTYFQYYGQRLGVTVNCAGFGEVMGYISQSGSPVKYYKNYVTNGQSNKNRYLIDEFDNLYTNQKIKHVAFLVTERSVKEIPVPSALISKLQSLHTGFSTAPNWSAYRTPDSSVNFTTANINTTGSYTFSGTSLVPVLNATNIVVRQRLGYNTSAATAAAIPNPTINTKLLEAYGLANFPSGTIDSTSYSPGIFALLDNGQTIRTATNPNLLTSYSQVATQYLSQYPGTPAYLATTVTSPSTGVYEMKLPYTKEQPASSSTVIPLANLTENKVAPIPVRFDRGTRLSVWNWGNLAFCAAKLNELGFTSADLTP